MPDMFGALLGIHNVGAHARELTARALVLRRAEMNCRKAAAAVNRAAVFVSASFMRRPECILFYFLSLVCRFWDSRISAYSFSPPVEITTRGMLGASGKFKH